MVPFCFLLAKCRVDIYVDIHNFGISCLGNLLDIQCLLDSSEARREEILLIFPCFQFIRNSRDYLYLQKEKRVWLRNYE